MKALVMALFLATSALSYALGEIVTPAMKDPYLIYVWAVPTAALAVQTIIFYWRYKKFDHDEFMAYENAEDFQGENPHEDEGHVNLTEGDVKPKVEK